ncbi:MAG: hypothetical protein AMXMBFR44_1000 [Candidatus Campbellbacteria bacterium]
MKTLGEARKQMERLRIKMAIFGVHSEHKQELEFRAEEIVRIFIEENAVGKGVSAPDDGVLGTRSSELLDATVEWFKTIESTWVPQEALEVS